MVDFSKLKSRRGSKNSELVEKLDKMSGAATYERDERIYKPAFDKKEQMGYAVVRFLPSREGDALVKKISHNFKCKNGFYNETSRATIGEKDPVAISNALYWAKGEAEGNDALKNIARQRKRNTKFYANVYVVKDKFAPENEGKVMIMEFGKQIFDKISSAIKPKFEDDKPIDPFDMWEGKDFIIRMEGRDMPDSKGNIIVVPNYESSKFADVTAELFEGNDEKKEEVFNKTYNLNEFLTVKSFDELAAIFLKRTGEAYDALEGGADPGDSTRKELERQMEQAKTLVEAEPQEHKVENPKEEKSASYNDEEDEDDDVLAQFKKFANAS